MENTKRNLQKQMLQLQRKYIVLEPFRRYIRLKYPAQPEVTVVQTEQEMANSPILVSQESMIAPHFEGRQYTHIYTIPKQK